MRFDETNRIFELTTANTSYILGINTAGGIQSLYWGERIPSGDCVHLLKSYGHSSFDPHVEKEREECSPWGGLFYGEPGLKVTFPDGVRDLKLEYSSHRTGGSADELVITMKDPHYALEVDLIYKTVDEYDLIERRCVIRNTGKLPIFIENAASAVWNLPHLENGRLTYVSGRWAGEGQLRQCGLSQGKMVLESRRGFTSSHLNPWFAVDDGAEEEHGRVWFGALAWSGNWKITVEKTSFDNLRVVGGVNDFDFSWELKGGEAFDTPVFAGGYSGLGFGGMSRSLHGYERSRVLPAEHSDSLRKVLYNSWEATYFNVNAEGQMLLAEKAAKLGVELFVVDDGWFGQRNSDKAGLGDWYVNRSKFPDGLAPLIKRVNELGMDFGIWVEPEMVNPDSELYRAHPDWVYGFPTREGSLGRNQLVLNLAKEEVKNYILGFMTDLLGSHPIRFIKWDMNRPISEPGWMEAPEGQRREVWVRHANNLYEIWRELKKRFPEVIFESCAGGGGRIDLGIMRYADQFWTSDNTDAFDRLRIQESFSYAYAPKAMVCWVTDSPNFLNGRRLSLKYRFLSAMTGSLGIGGNLKEWTEEELAEAQEMVGLYKEIRPIVQHGSQYRLSSPRHGNAAVQYVGSGADESVVFAFSHSQQFGESLFNVRLKGLEPGRPYSVRTDGEEPLVMSGSGLMNIGLFFRFKGDFDCKIARIKAG